MGQLGLPDVLPHIFIDQATKKPSQSTARSAERSGHRGRKPRPAKHAFPNPEEARHEEAEPADIDDGMLPIDPVLRSSIGGKHFRSRPHRGMILLRNSEDRMHRLNSAPGNRGSDQSNHESNPRANKQRSH